jgi:glycerol kinase
MLSWQDQRTDSTPLRAHADEVHQISGLPLDPMFSATKARWLLDAYGRDNVCLGTVDSFLLHRLGGGHIIEAGNAARTQLLDVRARDWSPALLDVFGVPRDVLPDVVSSTGPFPGTRGLAPLPDGTPVGAVMGDSHAALFAHAGWRPGQVKATYGTGSSIMALADPAAWRVGGTGLCLTIAWDDEGAVAHAFEGNIRSTGGTLTWLAALLGTTPAALAAQAADSADGVHLVPAFGGLAAPWWDDAALITGLTFATRLPQLARAALESIAFQVEDTVAAIDAPVETLLADGGPTANATLMQLQADTSGRAVARSLTAELSALGAAHLAGRVAGVWTQEQLEALDRPRELYEPREAPASREARVAAWHAAVARARGQEEKHHASL